MTEESFTFRGIDMGGGTSYAVDATSVRKIVVTVPMSRELWMDALGRRRTHPWEFPDRNPFPFIDPVPWYTHAIERWNAARQRVRDIRFVVRHGIPVPEDEDDEW